MILLCDEEASDVGCKSKSDEEILMADLDAEALRLEELVLLCDEEASDVVKSIGGVRCHVTQEAPRRVVRFPWGDVPSPWVENYSTIYDTGIDDSVFVLDECILTSLTEDDDPSWEQAIKCNDRQEWYAAADQDSRSWTTSSGSTCSCSYRPTANPHSARDATSAAALGVWYPMEASASWSPSRETRPPNRVRQ